MLPRQFLVKAILNTLKRNTGPVSPEILASRIADQVEIAADVFESHDDPIVMPTERTAPGTPEDLGESIERAPRKALRLPQPELTGGVIVTPDSPEGKDVLARRRVTPIRAARGQGTKGGEIPEWDFQELYAEVIGEAPLAIEVTPHGSTAAVTLSRSFQADPSSGVLKVLYTLDGQRGSAPSTADNPAAPISIPIDVSASFSIFSPRAIDFDAIVADLKSKATGAFAPRPGAITSATPRTAASLESVLRSASAQGTRGTPAQESETGNFANAVIDLSTP